MRSMLNFEVVCLYCDYEHQCVRATTSWGTQKLPILGPPRICSSLCNRGRNAMTNSQNARVVKMERLLEIYRDYESEVYLHRQT